MSSTQQVASMKVLVEEYDWSTTPLGPRDRWPQSLRAAVQIVLTSRFAMWMSWGPELTFLYNDAYGSMTLGKKHPWALGKPSRDVWAEIWPDIGPRIQHVFDTGEATWDERLLLFLERSGYPEETYHTFSYSPLADDSGRVAGHLCVVTEETERVIGERRLATLRHLASELASTTHEPGVMRAIETVLGSNRLDLPFALLYLYDSTGTRARRVALTSIATSHAAAVEEIDVADEREVWPASQLVSATAPIIARDIDARFADLPFGAWDVPPRDALVVPITQQGQERNAGFLVAALNPYRQLDESYSGFISLIAGQLASSLGNARAYEEERRRAEALAELDRAKTQFFSNVSHEFRTPLTLMLGPAEDALRDVDTKAANRERIEVVHRNALRLLKLVNTLLDFSRIEAGRIQASYVPTDISAMTSDVGSTFRSAMERAGLALTIDAPPLGVPVYVDHDMWEKVVLNLLSNAFKHTFEGGVTISVRRAEDEEHVEVSVADTGVGIAADQLPHLFERFHRVANARSRTYEGTGIGLALVQELVALHGGSVSVESQEGVGTTFIVKLPIGSAHLPAAHVRDVSPERRASAALDAFRVEALRWVPDGEALPSVENSASAAPDMDSALRGARVLLADDNADMREYVGRLLTAAGWHVTAVGDGEAALSAVRKDPPDLVLTDVMMPRLDGFGLLRELRGHEATRSIPVILLSARAGEEARVGGMSAGADDYLVKPFAAQELIARVGAHLKLSRIRSEASLAVQQARDAAVAMEQRLRSIVAQAPVAVAVLRGTPLRFEIVNEYYERLASREAKDLIGRTLTEAFPELDLRERAERLESVRSSGQADRADEFYAPVLREHGVRDFGFFNYVYQPLRNEHGEVDGVAIVVQEVTALVLAREAAEAHSLAAEQSRQAAEDANQAKTGFLAAMSHELRTPLNAIQGHVQLIEMGLHGAITDAQRDALVRVQRSQQHLLSLINDVLNFAKLEAGRVEYRHERVPIGEAVEDVRAMIDPQMRSKGLEFAANIPANLAVTADREKLQQIMLNLLSNAVKFTDRAGRITVSAHGSGTDCVAIEVADTGVGIPREKCESIFEPFVQLERNLTHSAEGTGLGLAISRDLARGMDGELTVTSEVGEGSTFTLTLPSGE